MKFCSEVTMESATRGRGAITIVIAVAVRLYREGLAAALGANDRFAVVATAATAAEAEAAARELQPDILIVDVGLDSVCDFIRTLRAHIGSSHILAFAVREQISAILEYAAAGADGFVTVNSSVAELVEAIERTAAGELLCSPQIAAQLLRRAAENRNDTSPFSIGRVLTGREQQVLSLLKQGQSNKEIGSALHISPSTVKNHVHNLLNKLQLTTRGQAMAAGGVQLKAALQSRMSSRRVG
jgi:DNA-binding NarL/FixJ family response regulator